MTTVLCLCVPNEIASKYVNYKWIELQGELSKFTTIMEVFIYTLLNYVRQTPPKKKISKTQMIQHNYINRITHV